MTDFQGAKITADTDFLLLREIDDRFEAFAPVAVYTELSGDITRIPVT